MRHVVSKWKLPSQEDEQEVGRWAGRIEARLNPTALEASKENTKERAKATDTVMLVGLSNRKLGCSKWTSSLAN